MNQNEDDMMTIPDAAQKLGVSVEALYKAIKRGKLTAQTKYGRKVISRTALDTWNKSRKMGRPPKK